MTFAIPLTELRALSGQFLPDTAVIQRATDVSSGDGTAQTWATLATVACRVSPVGSGGAEAMGAANQVQAIGQRRISLPALTDITTRDRVVVGARTYEVVDVHARGYEVIRTVVAREIS